MNGKFIPTLFSTFIYTAPTSITVNVPAPMPGAAVTLQWSGATGTVITGYAIYRATSPTGTYSFLQSVSTNNTWGTLAVTAPSGINSSYYYKVITVGLGGESGLSAYAGFTTKNLVYYNGTFYQGSDWNLSWSSGTQYSSVTKNGSNLQTLMENIPNQTGKMLAQMTGAISLTGINSIRFKYTSPTDWRTANLLYLVVHTARGYTTTNKIALSVGVQNVTIDVSAYTGNRFIGYWCETGAGLTYSMQGYHYVYEIELIA